MKELEIKNGTIFLDGEKVPCVKSFNVIYPENCNGVAEITIRMDVSIVHRAGQIESK